MKELKEDWQEVRLGDLGEIVTGNTPRTKNTEYFGNDYNFVTPSDYKNLNKYISHTERGISKLGENKFKNKMLPPNSIMVTCIGSDMGRILINKNRVLTNQQINSIIVNPDKYFYDFIYYMLVNNSSIIKASVSGTAVPILNKSDFSNLEFKIPNLEKQKKIASILSSLDDKIELNNRMNKILEETAQTIFKEWFINFNFPNEEGKPYKKSGGKMIESELGEIPEGWEVTTLENILKVIKGKKPKETHIKKTDLLNSQYLTIDCYNNSNIEYTEYVEKMYVDKLDIIMVMDGASSGKLFYGKNGILSSTMAKFYVENKNINEIVFFFLKKIENEIMYHTTGSAIPHANKQFILNKKIVLPPKQLLNLTNYIKTIREKIISNIEENKKLASIRDSILPKLMSGEIRIK
ncbi:restriction endonuclease subunit S [Brachyspira hyodysenteriae]|uniref:restriction endonuclease subunit S n=3 Tax=Brachyspira hyodysenteriae TaxID=159 RepID=UPI00063D925B|nr:restriction endonuclease subunit S [Brachyspira hyodysenteriae]MDA0061832.1 restriction endonuclease subunit S [Brachyspira hyodysenteriae]